GVVAMAGHDGHNRRNGIMWGPTLDDFFLLQQIPSLNVLTFWSRSMIKEYGELSIEDGDVPNTPRIRRPYPLLKIDKGVECPESSMYSCLDDGPGYFDPIPQQFCPDRLIVTDPFCLAFGAGRKKAKKREPEPWVYER